MTHASTPLLLIGTLLFLTPKAWGTEPFRPDVTGKINTEGVLDVDHLEPCEGKVPLPEYYYLVQFIESPSLATEGDYLVVLRTDDQRYLLQATKVPIEKLLSKPTKVDIEIQIPESLASVIYDLWVNALLEVCYERRQHGGLDGENYLFSTFVVSLGWMHGCTWSPQGDLPPVWMMEAGKKLIAYARAKKRDPKTTEAELVILRDKLFRYIKAHGRH
jgi:hypothetical protein